MISGGIVRVYGNSPQSPVFFRIMFMDISTWYSSLPFLLQMYWGCAAIGSIIFIIQLILTLIGMDSGDVDVDFDGANTMDYGDGLSLFSVRALINFLVGFGFSGVCFFYIITNKFLLIIISISFGVLLAWSLLLLWNKIKGLEKKENYSIQDSVGITGTVYLRIPAGRQANGKVQVSLGGSIREFAAITNGEALPTGTMVKIIEIINGETVLVEKL